MTKQNKKTTAALIALLVVIAAGTAAAIGIFGKSTAEPQKGGVPAAESDAPTPAADFTVFDADGAAVSLSDFAGEPVLLNFWASWCPPCRAELPDFESAYQTHGSRVRFLMIDLTDGNRETQQSGQAFADDNGYTFPLYFDLQGSAAKAYQIMSIPQTVLIDAAGNVLYSHTGALTHNALEEALALLTE